METIGLLLAVPGAVFASLLYCAVLAWLKPHLNGTLITLAMVGSALLVAAFTSELVLLARWGPLESRAVIGPMFWHIHRGCFYLVTPATANLLLLRHQGIFARWYLAALPSAAVGVFAVVVEYTVSDALYGPNGIGGPYGDWHVL